MPDFAAVPGRDQELAHVLAREALQVRPALLYGYGQQLANTPWWVASTVMGP